MKMSTLHTVFVYGLLLVLTTIIFFPVFWMVSTAFKEPEAAAEIPPHFDPDSLQPVPGPVPPASQQSEEQTEGRARFPQARTNVLLGECAITPPAGEDLLKRGC